MDRMIAINQEYHVLHYGPQILDKLHSKGWNVYDMTDKERIGKSDVVKNCLIDKLESDRNYVILPVVEDPRNPEQIDKALEKFDIKLGREFPSIRLEGCLFPWTGFTLEPVQVEVHTPLGIDVSYSSFLEALGNIDQAR